MTKYSKISINKTKYRNFTLFSLKVHFLT